MRTYSAYYFRILLGLAFLMGMSEPAYAARIKGKVKGSGVRYNVIAVSKDGRSTIAVPAANGNFSITVKKSDTLHLVNSAGRYWGPVVAVKGSRAFAALSGKNGSLGTLAVKSGFAAVAHGKVQNLFASGRGLAFNSRTGPKGAGRLGLVRMTGARSAAVRIRATAGNVGSDADSDGLPDLLDIDDDGDLVLDVADDSDRSNSEFNFKISSTLRMTLANSLNANAGSAIEELIDDRLREGLILGFHFRNNVSETTTLTSVNVDCLSLPYCMPGTGSALLRTDALSELEGTPWINYDTDGDGYPNLRVSEGPQGGYVGVKPKVGRQDLRPGDTLYFKALTSRGALTLPSVLPFYFVTAPALKEYSSGSNSGAISYPVAQGAPGTSVENPIVLGSPQVTLSFWRPQRPAIAGAESGTVIDMGNLTYGLSLSVEGRSDVYLCTTADYTNLSPTLTAQPREGQPTVEPVKDAAADAAADPANVLSFTVDLGACLARRSVAYPGLKVMIDLNADDVDHDQTSQSFYVQLPGA